MKNRGGMQGDGSKRPQLSNFVLIIFETVFARPDRNAIGTTVGAVIILSLAYSGPNLSVIDRQPISAHYLDVGVL